MNLVAGGKRSIFAFVKHEMQFSSVRLKHHKMARKPLKKFKPTQNKISYSEENYETNLDGQEDFSHFAEKLVKIPKDPDTDYLPPGVSKDDFPKYEQIFGWDSKNPLTKRLRHMLNEAKNPSEKEDSSLILLESKRLIQDAMNAGLYPKTCIFSRLNLLLDLPWDKTKSLELVQIPYKNMKLWTEMSTSPGIMGNILKINDTLHAF